MSKHTPAPWTVNGRAGTPGEAFLIDSGARVIAFTAAGYDEETDSDIVGDEEQANAALIAAAPELLDALRSLLDNLASASVQANARRVLAKAQPKP